MAQAELSLFLTSFCWIPVPSVTSDFIQISWWSSSWLSAW